MISLLGTLEKYPTTTQHVWLSQRYMSPAHEINKSIYNGNHKYTSIEIERVTVNKQCFCMRLATHESIVRRSNHSIQKTQTQHFYILEENL